MLTTAGETSLKSGGMSTREHAAAAAAAGTITGFSLSPHNARAIGETLSPGGQHDPGGDGRENEDDHLAFPNHLISSLSAPRGMVALCIAMYAMRRWYRPFAEDLFLLLRQVPLRLLLQDPEEVDDVLRLGQVDRGTLPVGPLEQAEIAIAPIWRDCTRSRNLGAPSADGPFPSSAPGAFHPRAVPSEGSRRVPGALPSGPPTEVSPREAAKEGAKAPLPCPSGRSP